MMSVGWDQAGAMLQPVRSAFPTPTARKRTQMCWWQPLGALGRSPASGHRRRATDRAALPVALPNCACSTNPEYPAYLSVYTHYHRSCSLAYTHRDSHRRPKQAIRPLRSRLAPYSQPGVSQAFNVLCVDLFRYPGSVPSLRTSSCRKRVHNPHAVCALPLQKKQRAPASGAFDTRQAWQASALAALCCTMSALRQAA